MEKQEAKSYFCPLTNKACVRGMVEWGTGIKKECVFRVTDTIPSGQCRLVRVMSGLERLDEIAIALNALAQGKNK